MPAFPKVLWKTNILKQYNAKKPAETMLLDLEFKVMDKALDQASKNHDVWSAFVDKHKVAAKKMLARADDAMKKIAAGDSGKESLLVKEIHGVVQRLGVIVESLKTEAEKYASAFADDGFRVDQLLKAITDAKMCTIVREQDVKKLLKPVGVKREAIILADRKVLADRKRVEEYEKRATVLAETAATLESKVKQDKSAFEIGMQKINTLFAGERGIDRLIERLDEKLEQAIEAGEKGPRVLAESKFKLGKTEFPGFRKNISGQIKTAVVQLQALKSLHGKRLYAKIPIAKATKRLAGASEKAKKQKAAVEGFERKMELLMAELVE